jgi:hypothetical protein
MCRCRRFNSVYINRRLCAILLAVDLSTVRTKFVVMLERQDRHLDNITSSNSTCTIVSAQVVTQFPTNAITAGF